MKLLFTLLVFFLFFTPLSAQISVGYFPFQSEVSISTNTNNLLWGEMRIATNTFFANVTTEPILLINFNRKARINWYGGVGSNLNLFNAESNISILNGFSAHVGSRVSPFENLKGLQIIFEVSPYFNTSFDGGILRTRLGVAYQFARSKQKSSSR